MLFGKTFSITDSAPVDLSDGLIARRYKLLVEVKNTIPIRLGDAGVTPTDGFQIESGDGVVELDLLGDPIYAIATSSSGPATVNVLVYD